MPKKLATTLVVLAMLLMVPVPALTQEELEGGSVLVEGDIVLDCAVFFDAFERFQNDPPDTRNEQRDFEEAQGYVQLCTERGVVPPFDESAEVDRQNAPTPSSGGSDGSGEQAQAAPARPRVDNKAKQLPVTGGVSPLVALGAGALMLGSGLLVRKMVR
ncbi:MAG: LPXTG cell wall anchor domain-containing protein [Actinobacteria bacterium]|nr:LPXTG cell wall anchor domain-containing protein [Actinomycetota bacterium]